MGQRTTTEIAAPYATQGTIRLHPLHWTTDTFLRSGAGIPAG
jgi:hypothetical protein